MKLELKHLTPYLPHNLMLMIDGVVCEIEGFDLYQIDTIIAERVSYNISAVKPILRPLSDLTKEIEEDFNVYSILSLRSKNDFDSGNPLILKWSFEDIQKLLEWHFDIYRLIEQGLAIDINDLKKSL